MSFRKTEMNWIFFLNIEAEEGCVAEVSPHEILIFKFLIKKVRKQTLLTFVFCRLGNAIAATIDQLPLQSVEKTCSVCLK